MKCGVIVGACLFLAACTPTAVSARATPQGSVIHSSAPTALTFKPDQSATVVSGGCGGTRIYRGGIPPSLNEAGGYNNPAYLPYVVTSPPIAAGFLFNYPLKHGPDGNKILWVVGAPRNGETLAIAMHPNTSSVPVVHFYKAADSGPGEIYPSGPAVPTAGCWVLSLRWGTHQAEADLVFS